MDSDDEYDEFGNYIGGGMDGEVGGEDGGMEGVQIGADPHAELFADEFDEFGGGRGADDGGREEDEELLMEEGIGSTAIVLPEDRKLFPEASEVYGEGVETLVEEEDRFGIEEPVVAPVDSRVIGTLESSVPELTYSSSFLTTLMRSDDLVRVLAVCGHLAHGKTTLSDFLVEQTHAVSWEEGKRWTDARVDEQKRGVSIKATPFAPVLSDSRGKHFLLSLVDVPGHPSLEAERRAAYRACDGVVVVVDAVEGASLGARRCLEAAVAEELDVVLVVNKVDRLILDLKLPPEDAQAKLSAVVDECNLILASSETFPVAVGSRMHQAGRPKRLDPVKGNVVFASAKHGWMVSLESAARDIVRVSEGAMAGVAKRLWGDWFLGEDGRRISRDRPHVRSPRTFAQLVLAPIYKAYAHVLGEEPEKLGPLLEDLGVQLRPAEMHAAPDRLLRLVMAQWLGRAAPLVDAAVRHVCVPSEGARRKRRSHWLGSGVESSEARVEKEVLGEVVKMVEVGDGSKFAGLVRVLSGELVPGATVHLREPMHEDRSVVCRVETLSVGQARYGVTVSRAPLGSLVLVGGLASHMSGSSATISSVSDLPTMDAALAEAGEAAAVLKVAVEPLKPSELPAVVAGLRTLAQSYPAIRTRVEDSGEHVLLGAGEFQLDCALYDLRERFARVEVKLSDPCVALRETVAAPSSLRCFADSPNGRNRLTAVAEPLEDSIVRDLDLGTIDTTNPASALENKHGWDKLAARGLWAFGPDLVRGPNALVDDTLPGEVDKKLLHASRDDLVHGFVWASRSGPLCEEPMRGVTVRLLDATLDSVPLQRGAGQIVPASRRVVYSAFLTAEPRLQEPWMAFETVCIAPAVDALGLRLSSRRGHVIGSQAIVGTPFVRVQGTLPALDAFGFETDTRVFTHGLATPLQILDGWRLVPGDPLDTSVPLPPLEPARGTDLARDLMVKTRLRKGLPQDVTVRKYFDHDMLLELARLEQEAAEHEEELRAKERAAQREQDRRRGGASAAAAMAADIAEQAGADPAVAAMFEAAAAAENQE